MRFIVVFVFSMFVQAHASTYGQTVSLNFKNASLENVLNEIQRQTQLELLYNTTVINKTDTKITIEATNLPFKNALEQVLKDSPLSFEIVEHTVLIKEAATNASRGGHRANPNRARNSQQTITGKVTDEEGNPVAGVSVFAKGTNIGTSTDSQGDYSINVPPEVDVLEFTIVGFDSQDVPVQSKNEINVTLLSQVDDLDEVVVVGYTRQKVRHLSSSVSNISAEKLQDVTANDLPSMLQGKAPGVVVSTASGDPSSEPSVLIRGAGTISASTAPLIVVDGNIGGTYNPSDVESVSILKDVAATGLYGSRAANGVIIVNT
ncbi:MAG: carboxypeptidase-like regulatory domain-containing protein, partial [Sphingobacterium sp.]